jgi:hypothetical protein
MLELLSTFSVEQIILYTVMLSFALKGGVEFFKWCKNLYQEKFDKDYEKRSQEELLAKYYEECSAQNKESKERYETLEKKIDCLTESLALQINKIEGQLNLLSSSSRNDIKAWIVATHHSCIEEGCIDDFTKDLVEKRYQDYVNLGGNSYVESLVEEIRKLPLK